MSTSTFGQLIKTKRRDNGLSLSGLARIVGCSGPYIVEIEKSLSHPSPQMTAKLAKALGLYPDAMVKQIFEEKMSKFSNELIKNYTDV